MRRYYATLDIVCFVVVKGNAVCGAAGTTPKARILVRHGLPSMIRREWLAAVQTAAEVRW
jgi:hypothetical protein